MSWDGISVRRPQPKLTYEQKQVREALKVIPAQRVKSGDEPWEAVARAAAERANREYERRHALDEGRYERHLVEMAMAAAARAANEGLPSGRETEREECQT
jgi:hypothetical protein